MAAFDGSVITYNRWDIAPAWWEQLAEGGRLVLPLEVGDYTRAVAFERRGQVLHARHFTHCGFVRDQGQQARSFPITGLSTVSFRPASRTVPTPGLEEALRGAAAQRPHRRHHGSMCGQSVRGSS
ncbi:hypothetical protein ACIGN6_36755 [Streptomyces sp. NPDC053792]|uniref:hypothetical protein n=1 Tax=Streptomyces sp. NPDC053792 TaxID=3365716 RepID=UPI0037D52EFF